MEGNTERAHCYVGLGIMVVSFVMHQYLMIHVAGARIGKKAVHLNANISLLLHHIIHHTHDPLSNDCLKNIVEAMAAVPHVNSIHQQKNFPF